MSDPMLINCGPHGQRVSAVVCMHLLASAPAPAGFIENSNDPNDLQAWCHRCEEKFGHAGEMTDAFKQFNGMSIVCVVCYGEAKSRHSTSAS
jgi:hypothetical protein